MFSLLPKISKVTSILLSLQVDSSTVEYYNGGEIGFLRPVPTEFK